MKKTGVPVPSLHICILLAGSLPAFVQRSVVAQVSSPPSILLGTWMTSISGVKPAFGYVPKGVEVSARYGADHTGFILVNVSHKTQSITLPNEMEDVLNGRIVRSVVLPNVGVAVLSETN
jgi:hypothetical protein